MATILLVGKVPAVAHLAHEDVLRLEQAGATNLQHLRESEHQHHASLDAVRLALRGQTLRERRVDELHQENMRDVDLVVSVGGDGTVLALAAIVTDIPVLAVNSDPARSVGHFTRAQAKDFPALLAAWQEQCASEQRIPRLGLTIDDQPCQHHILNDCLFTNCNPAAMTRYRMDWDGLQEQQFSSGVWIATGAGSTAAIHSAGMPPCCPDQAALLFQVREPYEGRGVIRLRRGVAKPPRPLTLTAAMPGIRCYIDGSHYFQSLPAGATARFEASPYPLKLVIPGTPALPSQARVE
jgi:NAD+ kinase